MRKNWWTKPNSLSGHEMLPPSLLLTLMTVERTEAGWTVLAEPLLDIVYERPVMPELAGYDGLIFTSRHGVQGFAALTAERGLPVHAVGAATARAARDAGFIEVLEGPGDASGLRDVLPQTRLLHPCGTEVRVAVGEALPVYRAAARQSFSAATRNALLADDIAAIMFFSPRTGSIFAGLAGPAERRGLSAVKALCLSDAVLDSVRDLGWRGVAVAARPDVAAMLALAGRPPNDA